MVETIIITIAVWFLGSIGAFILEGGYKEMTTADIIWWPIALLKFLLKTLWEVLSTW